jgi:hypothetical protein
LAHLERSGLFQPDYRLHEPGIPAIGPAKRGSTAAQAESDKDGYRRFPRANLRAIIVWERAFAIREPQPLLDFPTVQNNS